VTDDASAPDDNGPDVNGPDVDGPDAPSPFPEWQVLREEIVPFVGERALSLLAFALFDEADGFEGAAYFRELLSESGTDVDAPEVTEAEGLLIRWGRLFARDAEGIPAEVETRFEGAFNAQLREKLVQFAALTVATATTEQQ
jgi:hypothetical protein